MLDTELVTYYLASIEGKTLTSAVDTAHVHLAIGYIRDQRYNLIEIMIWMSIQEHTEIAYRSVVPAKRRTTSIIPFEGGV
jgi:hypothetical protein